jgi:predicted Zn-dependent protease
MAVLLPAFISCASTLKKAQKKFTPSVEGEKEMGREFAAQAAEQIPLVENPEVVEYVTRVGQPIIDAAQPMPFRFRFHVIKDSNLNAFAVPGGHIYFFSGMLLKAQNVQQVAAVMAHELAHVKHRHSAEMIGKGTLVNLASLAAMILAGVAGAGQAGAVGAVGAGQALQMSFSREFEREADRHGLFYLQKAGYDPHGLIDFFSMMIREQKFSTAHIPPYLLTHPVSQERMMKADSQIRINRLFVDRPREVEYFYRFQGILQAETGNATQVIPMFKRRLDEAPDDPHLWHQLGLAYTHYGYTQDAIQAYQRALELDPELCPAWVDLGSLMSRMQKWAEAQAMFDQATSLRPNYPEAYVAMGNMFIKLNEPRHAKGFLQRALSLDPNLIGVHKSLGMVRKEMGDDGGFHMEMATYYEKLDRSKEALQHLDQALMIYGEASINGQKVKQRIQAVQSS